MTRWVSFGVGVLFVASCVVYGMLSVFLVVRALVEAVG